MNHLMMKKTKAGQRTLTVKSTVTSGQKRVIKRQIPGIL